jgi:UrcA family protein
MFTAIFLSLATNVVSVEPEVIVAEDAPTVVIPLASYDLARSSDVERLKLRIHAAARSVCDRSYRGVMYLERVACVKSAIASAETQLGQVRQRQSIASLGTAIAVISR